MKINIGDFFVNVLDGLDLFFEHWPKVFVAVLLIAGLLVAYGIGSEDYGIAGTGIGIVVAGIVAAWRAGRPK